MRSCRSLLELWFVASDNAATTALAMAAPGGAITTAIMMEV